jgi:hypothetical protein
MRETKKQMCNNEGVTMEKIRKKTSTERNRKNGGKYEKKGRNYSYDL